jgi:hypothetical protein
VPLAREKGGNDLARGNRNCITAIFVNAT